MDRDDLNMQIVAQLKAINKDSGGFVAGLISNDLPEEDQIAFAHRLVDIAELIQQRATTTVVVDAVEGGVIVDSPSRTHVRPDSRDTPRPTARRATRRALPPGHGNVSA